MTLEQIRKAVKVDAFKPFTLSLADGRRMFVPHPEFIWIPPEATRTFHIAGAGEDYSVVDLLMVTSIDFGNGGGRKLRTRPRKNR